jgi:hypothetical protein
VGVSVGVVVGVELVVGVTDDVGMMVAVLVGCCNVDNPLPLSNAESQEANTRMEGTMIPVRMELIKELFLIKYYVPQH